MKPTPQFDFSQVHVLDGGMATELERRGCDISGPLWSAHVLDSAPDIIRQVHLDYLRAGAGCISTASYQISALGYAGLGRSSKDAETALRNSVSIAESARAEYLQEANRPIGIPASLGPYGAALHNGAEFHGRYNINYADLVVFHSERLRVIAETNADLVALETVPSREEAHAILEALNHYPTLRAWISFVCGDSEHVAHGEPLSECIALAESSDQIVAAGINCTQPGFLLSLIRQAKAATSKPILVYPNSGETWDAEGRKWCGVSDVAEYGAQALTWFEAGAQAVGGCCRTTPDHIRAVREAWRAHAERSANRHTRTPAAMRQ